MLIINWGLDFQAYISEISGILMEWLSVPIQAIYDKQLTVGKETGQERIQDLKVLKASSHLVPVIKVMLSLLENKKTPK